MSNTITITGSITSKGVTLDSTHSGVLRARFSMSDSRNTAPKDAEPKFENNWWNVTLFGPDAEKVAALPGKTKIRIQGQVEQYKLPKDEEADVKYPRVQVKARQVEVSDGNGGFVPMDSAPTSSNADEFDPF